MFVNDEGSGWGLAFSFPVSLSDFICTKLEIKKFDFSTLTKKKGVQTFNTLFADEYDFF